MVYYWRGCSVTKRGRNGERFRLLVYERMWQRWAWPCILIVLASVVLWWFAPRISIIYRPWNSLTLVPALASLVLLAYAYLARRLSWVQCRANHLRIQTPFYPLVISYSRVKGARPNPFHKVFDPHLFRGKQAQDPEPIGIPKSPKTIRRIRL